MTGPDYERLLRETARDCIAQIGALSDELDRLRERVSSHPHDIAMLERRLADARSDARTTAANNERLAATLREARDQIVSLKTEVDRLAQPPASFGVFLAAAGGPHRRHLHRRPQDAGQRQPRGRPGRRSTPGREVMVNEAMNVVAALDFDEVGEVVLLKELLEDGDRALVVGHGDEESVVRLATRLQDQHLRSGDSLLIDRRVHFAYERIPKLDVEELVLEEVPGHRLLGDRRPGLARSRRSGTRSSCRSCTRSCSSSTSSRRPRASCSTVRPAAARP